MTYQVKTLQFYHSVWWMAMFTVCVLFDSCQEKMSTIEYDFVETIDGDSVFFKVLDGDEAVSLVQWGLQNFDNHVLTVPASVIHNGRSYTVTEIGDEAMGVAFYSDRERTSIWVSIGHKVEKVILPTSVRRIGDAAFTARFRNDFKVVLTDSIEYIGYCAINCSSICDENYAVVLPANLREMACMYGPEDPEFDCEDLLDFRFSMLYIPEHLEYIGGLEYFDRNQPRFQKVVVHPNNTHFRVINDALYSAGLDEIHWATVRENLYIPKTLQVDRAEAAFLEECWAVNYRMPKFTSITVEAGNPWCYAHDNILYDKATGNAFCHLI